MPIQSWSPIGRARRFSYYLKGKFQKFTLRRFFFILIVQITKIFRSLVENWRAVQAVINTVRGRKMLKTLGAMKEIIAVAASIVAVVAGIATGLAFFATKDQLDELRCEAFRDLQLSDANLRRLEAEQTAFNGRVTLQYLREKEANNTEMIKVEQLVSAKEKERDIAIQDQNDLNNAKKSGICKI